MLGMLPLGGRVLNGLGLRERYIDQSQSMGQYALHGRNGQLIREFPDQIIDRFGLYQGIERGSLLGMLRQEAEPIMLNGSVRQIQQNDSQAVVTFSDGSTATLDLVSVLTEFTHRRVP